MLERILKIQEQHHVVELLTLLISMARPFDLLQCLPLSTGQVVTSKVTAGNATDAFSLSYTHRINRPCYCRRGKMPEDARIVISTSDNLQKELFSCRLISMYVIRLVDRQPFVLSDNIAMQLSHLLSCLTQGHFVVHSRQTPYNYVCSLTRRLLERNVNKIIDTNDAAPIFLTLTKSGLMIRPMEAIS